jgi:1-pyrroline-5-carboxylate dehydrogenase
MTLNAATMLGQSKTAHQAEIEAACELSDFLRFGVHNMRQIYSVQPGHQGEGAWNRLDYRPLEGFVFAVSPFNFTAIGGNLSASPALMGNTILWKPASTGVFSSHFVMRVFLEAGLPDGVINFLPGDSKDMELLLTHPDLAGVHFTGSTGAFRRIWKTVAANIETYKNYPRLVGETGGKDFAMVHASADPQVVATALVRGAFEYQGQKCSATSRAYIPKSLWGSIEEELHSQLSRVKVGDIEDFGKFHGRGYRQNILRRFVEHRLREKPPERDNRLRGTCDDSRGFFVEPTVILTTDPKFRLMGRSSSAPC